MLAIHSVVSAKGSGETPVWRAIASPTGVRSTAVVSRLSTTVHSTASAANVSHRSTTRWRARWASAWAATSNTPASWATSAVTVIASRKKATGSTCTRTGWRASLTGSR